MNYPLVKELVDLAEAFESQNSNSRYSSDLKGFNSWLVAEQNLVHEEPPIVVWEGMENGRSADSVINTLFVHLNRYAKIYAKAAIHDSPFSTPEEFIYLINLNVGGPMTKTQLIKKNIQDKSFGMQIINRLIKHGWVTQTDSQTDARSKVIEITDAGLDELSKHMDKIRHASQIVTGDLDDNERILLIQLLTKLDAFHKNIFEREIPVGQLLERIEYNTNSNV